MDHVPLRCRYGTKANYSRRGTSDATAQGVFTGEVSAHSTIEKIPPIKASFRACGIGYPIGISGVVDFVWSNDALRHCGSDLRVVSHAMLKGLKYGRFDIISYHIIPSRFGLADCASSSSREDCPV